MQCKCGCEKDVPESKGWKKRVFFDKHHYNKWYNDRRDWSLYRNRKPARERTEHTRHVDSFEPGARLYDCKCPTCGKIHQELFNTPPLVMPRVYCPLHEIRRSISDYSSGMAAVV